MKHRDILLNQYLNKHNVYWSKRDPGIFPKMCDSTTRYWRDFEMGNNNERIKIIEILLSNRFIRKVASDVDSFHFLIDFYLLFYSSENYNPRKALKLFNSISTLLGLERKSAFQGVYGHFREISDEKASERVWALTRTVANYFDLNEDYYALEKFLCKHRLGMYYTETHQHFFNILVALKRDPDSRLFSTLVIGYNFFDVSSFKTVGNYRFRTNTIKAYLNKPKFSIIEVYAIADAAFRERAKLFPNWFYHLYLHEPPKGILMSPHYNNRDSGLNWGNGGTCYPSWHRFHKGLPDTSMGFPARHKVAISIELKNTIENWIRARIGLPKIGEGWVAERTLLYKIRKWFPRLQIVHQWRPHWLGRQSIDMAIPKLNIGIEFQGAQHFEAIDYFGGKKALKAQKARDLTKANKCKLNMVKLLIVSSSDSDSNIRKKISVAIGIHKRAV